MITFLNVMLVLIFLGICSLLITLGSVNTRIKDIEDDISDINEQISDKMQSRNKEPSTFYWDPDN